MMTEIHVAHAVSHKGGLTNYRARAFALDLIAGKPIKHTYIVALGDTALEATRAAAQYVRDTYRREGLVEPQTVIDHGKMRGALLDAYCFGPSL